MLLTATLVVAFSGCNDTESSSQGALFNNEESGQNVTTEFNESKLVEHLTNNVLTPTYEEFSSLSLELHESVIEYCESEREFSNSTITTRERDDKKLIAQQDWKKAMLSWQLIELMQIGPLVNNQNSLRNKIYSWPVVSNCAVDQDVVFYNAGEVGGDPYRIENRVVTRRGLDTLEYLLFNQNLNHSCTPSTAPEPWESLQENEQLIQRCSFAEEVARDVANNSSILLDEWSGENGYADSLLNAENQPGDDFESVHEAVNRISDALFYADSITKDAKLGVPLGLSSNSCQQNICAENLESQFARHSLENIKSNLLSLRIVFNGESNITTEQIGFSDFLAEEGAESTATLINQAIDRAITNIDLYQENLNDALLNDPSQVQATYDDVKAITDQMKTDFITELALKLPSSSAGDND